MTQNQINQMVTVRQIWLKIKSTKSSLSGKYDTKSNQPNGHCQANLTQNQITNWINQIRQIWHNLGVDGPLCHQRVCTGLWGESLWKRWFIISCLDGHPTLMVMMIPKAIIMILFKILWQEMIMTLFVMHRQGARRGRRTLYSCWFKMMI